MMRIRTAVYQAFGVVLLVSLLALSGCEGTETRGKVDDTVEKFTGKEQVEKMEKIKEDYQKNLDKQAERLKEAE